MPNPAPAPCSYPGCKILTTEGKCKKHKHNHGWRHKKSASQRGYGSHWTKLRKIVLARDNHLCQQCIRNGRTMPGNQVDHIIPKQQGGTDDLSNLQTLCKKCHDAKTYRERNNGNNY